jgi:hypothetical protein
VGAIQVSDRDYIGPGAQPQWGSEQEILLQDGLQYRIVSDEQRPSPVQGPGANATYRHLVVEVVPPKEKK